ncbi:glycosyltransferase family 2 protein [Thioalkalivibrio thiocyanodenitrificans]|uniref:glycosyltransferase family 2 protein n=1 Tax=Thioalkalivibrio thiocyanodenitrificans TaxID=243063 RepID=UPI000382168F|nr:glycosyltransferase family 2 protein [Thioalkalivibrio thiocyanodenitrificans]
MPVGQGYGGGGIGSSCDLTVAIVTRNRAGLLDRALASLGGADKPPGLSYEILVVLNACTDRSEAVVRRHARQLPVRFLDEPCPGISHARNAAIGACSGRVIAWIDDDVVVGRSWFEAYARALAAHPGAAFFGGPIEPLFEGEIPPWFHQTWRLFTDVFAVRHVPCDAPVHVRYLPYGANYAVRSDWQRRFAYDPGLGRRPGFLLIGGEETALLNRILAAGGRGQWIADARVQHVISGERRTRRHLVRHYAGHGYRVGCAVRAAGGSQTFPVVLGLIRMMFFAGALMVGTLAARPAFWVRALRRAAFEAGCVMGRMNNDRAPEVSPRAASAADVSSTPEKGGRP